MEVGLQAPYMAHSSHQPFLHLLKYYLLNLLLGVQQSVGTETYAPIPSFEIFSHKVTAPVAPSLGIFATALLMRLNSIGEVQKETLRDGEHGALCVSESSLTQKEELRYR